jgi:hypothetical protein
MTNAGERLEKNNNASTNDNRYKAKPQSKRAGLRQPFVLTNPLNSVAKLQIATTKKNIFLTMLISFDP